MERGRSRGWNEVGREVGTRWVERLERGRSRGWNEVGREVGREVGTR